MDKALFLAQLQKNIGMLDDNEQKDILDEYSQHIDMKVAGGMTEAEAIEDFGDFDEFVREILSAYHVKAPFDQDERFGKEAQSTTSTAGDHGSDTACAKASALGKAASATKNGARAFANAATSALGKTKARTIASANNAREARKARHAAESAAGAASSASPSDNCASAQPYGFPRRIASWLAAAWRTCWNLMKTAIRWMWNACIACCAAACLVMGLVSLFFFGACIVLLVQGYPAAGLAIAGAGSTLMLGSGSYLLSKLIILKRAHKPAESSLPNTQDANGTRHDDGQNACAAEEGPGHTRADARPADRTAPMACSASRRQREAALRGEPALSSIFSSAPMRPAHFDTVPLAAKGGAWND